MQLTHNSKFEDFLEMLRPKIPILCVCFLAAALIWFIVVPLLMIIWGSFRDVPPGVAGGITGIQQVFAQNLGVLGKGIKWFVYDGTWLKTCGRGHFWITVSGTEYDYVTPVPGCPKIPSGIEPS